MNAPDISMIEVIGIKISKQVYAVVPNYERRACNTCNGNGFVKIIGKDGKYKNDYCPDHCFCGFFPYLTHFYIKKIKVRHIAIGAKGVRVYTRLSPRDMLNDIFISKKEAENECNIRNQALPKNGLLAFNYSGAINWDKEENKAWER